MIKRKCGTCRFWKEARLVGNGWCQHPQRRTTSDVMIMVRRNELACRNLWDADLWSPRGGDDDLSSIDGPESFVARRMAPATAEEIAALVNARNQLTQENQLVHEDVVVGEALVMPERSARMTVPASTDLTVVNHLVPGEDEQSDVDLSGVNDSTPLETPSSVNARAAIFKARDQFRSRSASSRSPASPLLPSLPDGFGDEPGSGHDVQAEEQQVGRAPFLSREPDRPIPISDPPAVDVAASLAGVRPPRVNAPDVADRFSSVPDVMPGFELPRAKRVTYQPPAAGLGTDADEAFIPSTAVRRAASTVESAAADPTPTAPWRWQPAPARDAEPTAVSQMSSGGDDIEPCDRGYDTAPLTTVDVDDVDILSAEAGPAAAGVTTDEESLVALADGDRFATNVEDIPFDGVEPEPEMESLPRRGRSWLPLSLRARLEPAVDPDTAYLTEDVIDDGDDLSPVSENDPWDQAPEWPIQTDLADPSRDEEHAIDRFDTTRLIAAATDDLSRFAEPLHDVIVQVEGRAVLDDLVLAVGVDIAPDLPRVCRTCRDFRPAEGGDRGWCTNTWAFDHRRMVDLNDQPCETSIGSWWLPADTTWQAAADVSSHGDPTPLVDRWLPHFDEYPVRAVAGEWRRRRS